MARRRLNRMRTPNKFGAGEESRTLDLNLGKVALYQLSYSRMGTAVSFTTSKTIA